MIFAPKWTTYYRMVPVEDAPDEQEARIMAREYVERCIAPRTIETYKTEVSRAQNPDWWWVVVKFKMMPEGA